MDGIDTQSIPEVTVFISSPPKTQILCKATVFLSAVTMNLAVFEGSSQKLFCPKGALRSKNFSVPSLKNSQNPRPC